MPRKAKCTADTEQHVFASRIREMMRKRGMTNEKLERIIANKYDLGEYDSKISRSAIGYYTQGQSFPSADKLRILCQALDVSADYLLGLTNETTPSIEERAVCEYLGLSEKAVDRLLQMKYFPTVFFSSVDCEMEQGFEDSAYKAVSDFLQDPDSYGIFAVVSNMKILSRKAFIMIDSYWKEEDPSIQDTYRDQITDMMNKVKITMYEMSELLDDLSVPNSDFTARGILAKLKDCLNDIIFRSLKHSKDD